MIIINMTTNEVVEDTETEKQKQDENNGFPPPDADRHQQEPQLQIVEQK